MTPLKNTRSLCPSTCLALAAALVFAAGFLPLFGGPGYEIALASGLLLPSLVAIDVAFDLSDFHPAPIDAYQRGVTRGLVFALTAYATTLVHGARVGFCSFWEGTLLFVLGPGLGALLGGAWGAFAGYAVSRMRNQHRWAAIGFTLIFALIGPLGSIAIGLLQFFLTPVVFVFDPFVGFFSGTLYDTVIDSTGRLLTYRLGTLLTLLGCAGSALHFSPIDTPPPWNQPSALRNSLRWKGWLSALTLFALLGSLAITLLGSYLDHWQTASTIQKELGGTLSGPRCNVVYPRSLREEEAQLFARDCEEEVQAVSDYLGIAKPPHITAFLFSDTAQKRKLMGAADTYVAKPWRHEVYVQSDGYPHPVLGHEIAHVVASTWAPGPLHIAGSAGGLIANPGLIEGLAVAASPDDDALSPEGWCKAMLEIGLLPRLSSLFSFGFLGHNASQAYTAAGAFVAWVHQTLGTETVRRWYGGEPLPHVAGKSWGSLETDFRSFLNSISIPPDALALAKARFDRPAVFGRTCPHEQDAKKHAALVLLNAGDSRDAGSLFDKILDVDPHDTTALLTRATCDERLGHLEQSQERLEALAHDQTLPRTTRDRAEERLGDLALLQNDTAQAEQHYVLVQKRILNEDQLRTLDIKLEAVRSPQARPAIVALLIGSSKAGPDPQRAAEHLGRWAEQADHDGLPLYLLGRSTALRGDWQRGAELLDQALASDHVVQLPRVAREAARLRVIAACARNDAAAAQRALAAWSRYAQPSDIRDVKVRALAARCAGRAGANEGSHDPYAPDGRYPSPTQR